MNAKCKECLKKVNTVNGWYCRKLRVIVEYLETAPCETTTTEPQTGEC